MSYSQRVRAEVQSFDGIVLFEIRDVTTGPALNVEKAVAGGSLVFAGLEPRSSLLLSGNS